MAALAIPPSLLAPSARPSTPGASSRLTQESTPGAEATASGEGIFPELLAGLVAPAGARADDGRGAPHQDTPAGIETWLKALLSAPRGEAAAPAAKGAHATRRGASTGPSGTAPKPAAKVSEPDPGQLVPWQNIGAPGVDRKSAPALPSPTLPAAKAADGQVPISPGLSGQSLSGQSLSGQSLSGQSLSGQSLSAQSLSAQSLSAQRMTAAVELAVEPGLPGQEPALPQAVAAGEPAGQQQTAPGIQPPHAPPAIPAVTARPSVAPVDDATPSLQPSILPSPQAAAKPPVRAGNPAGAGIELSPLPVVALPAVRSAALPVPPTAVTGQPPQAAAATDPSSGAPPKQLDPTLAQAALAPALASPRPPATRPPSGGPDGARTTDEMAVHASRPAPVAPPAAAADSAGLSGRRANRTPLSSTPSSRRSSGSVVAQVLALSGQAPRTIDSIATAAPAPLSQPVEPPASRPLAPPADPRPALQPPALPAPPEAAPGSPDESLMPSPDGAVRVLKTSTPDLDEVAFALRVKATPTPAGAASQASPSGLAANKGDERATLPVQPGGAAAPDLAAAGEKHVALADDQSDHTPARAVRERRADESPAERTPTPAGAPAGKTIQSSGDAQVRTETVPERPPAAAAADAKPVRPQDLMEGAAKPDAATTPLVHDMKFEVTGGQQRVEVRLSEHAGEVKMTVRTADEPLADTLRENLPALSARLAESGLKSEAWHPAASSTNELRHAAEPGARGTSQQDGDAQPRQQDRQPQDGAGQRRPRNSQEATPQKEKGKDFAWLMSSLR